VLALAAIAPPRAELYSSETPKFIEIDHDSPEAQ
jgi:hypothetical protein